MFKNYNIIIANDTNQYTLTYNLKEHRPAQEWARIMSGRRIEHLRKTFNPWQGIKKDIQPLVDKLFVLIEELNTWLPEKIDKVWNSNDIQTSVNEFHTHFPEQNGEKDLVRREQLRRYNDLIHNIESTDRLNKGTFEYPNLTIFPDFVNENITVPYELDDYQYFNDSTHFGDLKIAYNHIGRHPIEIFYAKDVNVPTEHIIPEHLIGPFHYLNFYQTNYNKEEFTKFYYESGIQWPYALDDPRLAVGRVSIGTLKYINNNVLSEEEILAIVKSCNKIVNWSIE